MTFAEKMNEFNYWSLTPLRGLYRMIKNKYVPILFGLLLLSACRDYDYDKKYGVSYNNERIKLGIPIIPGEWRTNNLGSTIDYVIIKENTNAPYHFSKRVMVQSDGSIASESDVYDSGKTYIDPDGGKMWEHLDVSYYYSDDRYTNHWDCTFVEADKFPKDVSLSEADQILSSWGLSRTATNK